MSLFPLKKDACLLGSLEDGLSALLCTEVSLLHMFAVLRLSAITLLLIDRPFFFSVQNCNFSDNLL